ncbi:MAG TPA: amidohydrolase [Pseudonocardia sp.]|nr:amidohydrolase [Pseudonocardia sp.]
MSADAIFVNGRVWPGLPVAAGPEPTAPAGDGPTAIAVSRGRVLAIGSDAEVRDLARPGCPVTDLGGRRVVPGLIDGHLHAVRAGATWDEELHWTGVPDVAAALASIRAEVARRPAGEWVRAIGGWHPHQFTEGRPPSRAELDAVAPEHPVYVQALYEYAVLNTAALRASGLDRLAEDPPGGHLERDGDGVPTGRISGLPAFNRCLAALPARGPEQERASTAAMQRELHAAGLTGVVDPGGFGMPPDRYDALFELWRRGELTLRMRLFLSAVDPGREYEQLEGWLRHGQTQFGDDRLRTLGVGELIHYGCHDFEGLAPFEISEAAGAEFLRISREAARHRWPMHVHAVLDSSIDRILDAWEQVHAELPLTELRFSLAHADRIGPRNIARLRALGAGVVVDDRLVFKAAASAEVWGDEAIRRAPPLADLLAAGIPVAAGTDATRASSYSPWLSLYWLVAGRSLDGVARREPRHLLSRERALHLYTRGSAWLSFEEADRGQLWPGALADFAVLDADYLTVPAAQIPAITSELTVVAGTPVHTPL